MKTAVIGYPYIGENRQWKRILENYWKGQLEKSSLEEQLKSLRLQHLQHQKSLGLDLLTVGDFTYYDRMLDLVVMFGMIPKRYETEEASLETYYAMARGSKNVVASEMTKWFNTNYHYIVPEYEGKPLQLTSNLFAKLVRETVETIGEVPRVTIIGPYTFQRLTKGISEAQRPAFLLQLIHVYGQLIHELEQLGVSTIQLEEPAFTSELTEDEIALAEQLYVQLTEIVQSDIFITTYFEGIPSLERILQFPVAGFGLDFVAGEKENIAALRHIDFPKDKTLAIGLVNGRDIWASNLAERTILIETIQKLTGAKELVLQTSCSLQHVPVTVSNETKLQPTLKNALAFADEKIKELILLKQYVFNHETPVKQAIAMNLDALERLQNHPERQKVTIQRAVQQLKQSDFERQAPYEQRLIAQKEALQLPDYPTTTIGSFPQSEAVRQNRLKWRKGEITNEQYEQFNQEETKRWIAIQEEIGLDVFVHGEFERTDMVEYFGEKLEGFAFTEKAWVVSYGSRCVKPPIIYGDVEWTQPMTVKETVYAQSLTNKRMKGMLTGPVTILNWSFVRNDLSRSDVVYQIAIALQQEVKALEAAGISIIQIDEPALKEGLPLRKSAQKAYVQSGIKAFKLTAATVKNETQIHTHMCYCEFNDFIEEIEALDADVISIETSRSHGELIEALKVNPYKLGIGLGVYDIHSPRVPTQQEIETILTESREVIAKDQFWINPDCGLKTRREEETIASLKQMVKAASILKQQVKA